jgi:membrane protease YdiL (CAAX protease family)
MENLTSQQLVDNQEVAHARPAVARTTLIVSAWISTLLLSNLPLVIARDMLGSDIPWMLPAWIGLAILFVAATFLWPVFKPLRGYFIVMGIILLLVFGIGPWLSQTAAWRMLFSDQPEINSVFSARVMLILQTLVVITVLFALGVKRREAFLTVGNMKAPVGGQAEPARKQRLGWHMLAPIVTVLLGGLFILFMSTQNNGAPLNLTAVLPWLPLILLSAAMNAFGEEMMYRAAPMSMLIQAVGPNHAIWLTAIWFGLGHYYGGIPSGLMGLVFTGGLALLLGKMMVDTRGMGWPWILHMVLDTVIYTFIALG